ncbi:MAG: putative sulfate exporter family transporter [Campylobacteraceae bacterium]|jgi:uncharacterized integral membrane protein (TIGR00698 family)|nr:putative sulfate exporter family transporter [Campylobacteraceae bacterium]MBT3882132.1 putative sulfate exporter family transporter [Campylobacteraceae bacterium]MBT4031140.1 putative sulfate exporter family transporter [Campylobacteraceae bacterium]MBT4178839.1 putative sulfate exporter family transporter [Campylobacteraceae bacterium]MBT4572068.1 putative sulfate exporter family transporter [Campylobacteraceae bacterium]
MQKNLLGILIATAIGMVAILLSNFITIGSVAIAIIVGVFIGNTIKLDKKFSPGITYSEKTLLAYAIALMGINLDFSILVALGFKTITLIIIALAITLLASIYLAKIFKFDTKFALMLGIGNGVCGSAAIAATKDIVKLDQEKVGLSVAIVNFLGTVGIFLVPMIGTYFLTLSDVNNGVLIGNTLQAVGQVIAGGFSINDTAGQTATIVKMGRILMLTPLIFVLIYFINKQAKNINSASTTKLEIPMFITGFVLFSIIATIGILPESMVSMISITSKYLLIIAMAAIGLKINFKTILQHGSTALLIGTLIFIIQIVFSSLAIILLF